MRSVPAFLSAWIVAMGGIPEARGDTAPLHLPRVTVFADIGYAYPRGTAETGTDTRDVSFGLVPLSLGGTYDLTARWSGSLRLRYAFNIPTLCASAPDCESSIGRDVAVAVGIGRALPRWWHLAPRVGFEVGWEWLTTELSDSGVVSSRSWNGPFARLEIFTDLKSGGPWSVGPALGIDVGLFASSDLDTPAGHSSGSTDTTIHAWPTVSFRVERRL